MNPNSYPFINVMSIVRNSLNPDNSEVRKKTESRGAIPALFIADKIVEPTFRNANEKELNGLNLYNSLASPSYYTIGRLANIPLKEFSANKAREKNFYDTCKLFTLAIEKNTGDLFNKERKEKAIEKINIEIQTLQNYVKNRIREKKYKSNNSSIRREKLDGKINSEGDNTLKIVRWIDTINKLIDLIGKTTKKLPDYMEEKIWYEDLDQLVVVSKEEIFLFNGDNRRIACCILHTPITKNICLIKLSADCWNNNKEHLDIHTDLTTEADCWNNSNEFLDIHTDLTIEAYDCIEDVIAALLHFINNESDVEFCLLENNSLEPSHFESMKSLEKKISSMLM